MIWANFSSSFGLPHLEFGVHLSESSHDVIHANGCRRNGALRSRKQINRTQAPQLKRNTRWRTWLRHRHSSKEEAPSGKKRRRDPLNSCRVLARLIRTRDRVVHSTYHHRHCDCIWGACAVLSAPECSFVWRWSSESNPFWCQPPSTEHRARVHRWPLNHRPRLTSSFCVEIRRMRVYAPGTARVRLRTCVYWSSGLLIIV